MNLVGQAERVTQDRVIALFRDQLGISGRAWPGYPSFVQAHRAPASTCRHTRNKFPPMIIPISAALCPRARSPATRFG